MHIIALFYAFVTATPNPQAAIEPSGARALTSSITGPHCSNGNLGFQLGTNISPQPMADKNGLASYTASFTNNGAPVQLISISAYNMQPAISGNGFTFSETDDIPTIGGAVVVGVACNNAPSLSGIQVVFTSQNNIQLSQSLTGGAGTGAAPGVGAAAAIGAVSGTPAGFVAVPGTVPGNAEVGTSGAGVGVSGSIVLTIGADPTQNGGQGINSLKCNRQGQVQATLNFLASINVNNINAYQPMAEIGLPTVTAFFTLGGQPATVNVQNTFSVASSSVSNNAWVFGLMDDGPHPGGMFTLGPCVGGAVPPIAVAFTSTPITNAVGLPHGADGGPPVPAVNGDVVVVNALPTQFQGTSAGISMGTSANSGAGTQTTIGAGTGADTGVGAVAVVVAGAAGAVAGTSSGVGTAPGAAGAGTAAGANSGSATGAGSGLSSGTGTSTIDLGTGTATGIGAGSGTDGGTGVVTGFGTAAGAGSDSGSAMGVIFNSSSNTTSVKVPGTGVGTVNGTGTSSATITVNMPFSISVLSLLLLLAL